MTLSLTESTVVVKLSVLPARNSLLSQAFTGISETVGHSITEEAVSEKQTLDSGSV